MQPIQPNITCLLTERYPVCCRPAARAAASRRPAAGAAAARQPEQLDAAAGRPRRPQPRRWLPSARTLAQPGKQLWPSALLPLGRRLRRPGGRRPVARVAAARRGGRRRSGPRGAQVGRRQPRRAQARRRQPETGQPALHLQPLRRRAARPQVSAPHRAGRVHRLGTLRCSARSCGPPHPRGCCVSSDPFGGEALPGRG